MLAKSQMGSNERKGRRMSSEHSPTPTPWKIYEWDESNLTLRSTVEETDVVDICFWDGEPEDCEQARTNAAFILQAVNKHEKLIEALKNLLKLGVCQREDHPAVSDARAVLASLERKEG